LMPSAIQVTPTHRLCDGIACLSLAMLMSV
jgi:hypothetical protein